MGSHYVLLGSILKTDHPNICHKQVTRDTLKSLDLLIGKDSQTYSKTTDEDAIMNYEFQLIQDCFKAKTMYVEKQTTKSAYLRAIQKGALNTSSKFFTIIYSGSTHWQTGDWAVLADDGVSTDSISLLDIYNAVKAVNYKGQFQAVLDAPFSGKWLQ